MLENSTHCPFDDSHPASMLWSTPSFKLRRCLRCGCHWTSQQGPLSPPCYDRKYYSQNYLGNEKIFQQNFFAEQLRALAPRVAGRRVLDIGFGAGLFLEEAVRQGWNASGIESSSDAHAQVMERKIGVLKLMHGDVLNSDIGLGSFDVITFWDVLAHVPDPKVYLQRAMAWLDPDGCLVIKTPFRSNAFFRACAALPYWMRESLIHWPWQNYFFSPTSLKMVLTLAGFSELDVRFTPELPIAPLSLAMFFKHPKGGLLYISHLIYNRLFGTRSMILYAKRPRP